MYRSRGSTGVLPPDTAVTAVPKRKQTASVLIIKICYTTTSSLPANQKTEIQHAALGVLISLRHPGTSRPFLVSAFDCIDQHCFASWREGVADLLHLCLEPGAGPHGGIRVLP